MGSCQNLCFNLGMNFRNILLLFSVVMIGFCLTLYFQNESSVKSMHIDQYKSLNYNKSRSHSLADFNEKIAPVHIEDLLSEIHEKNKLLRQKTRVMEIGFGNGRVLLELKKLFPDVEFYGINKEKTRTFYRRESFILTALKFDLMTKVEAESMILPYVVFQNLDFGQRIPYDGNKFDLIYSQSTISNIRYSFELFNEIMRVLKNDGVSVHSDVTGVNIYARGLIISMKEAAKEFRKKGIDIYVLDNPESLRFKKPDNNTLFPVTPHLPIPTSFENLSPELSRPEMNYNFNI
jgi:ubiquinone/menaquinone biosynthesis C-methylase UbiE